MKGTKAARSGPLQPPLADTHSLQRVVSWLEAGRGGIVGQWDRRRGFRGPRPRHSELP